MTQYIPELYKIGTVTFATAAPTTLISQEAIGTIERYGIAGVMLLVAALFYSLWRVQAKEREIDHKAHIQALEAEIQRLRAKHGD